MDVITLIFIIEDHQVLIGIEPSPVLAEDIRQFVV